MSYRAAVLRRWSRRDVLAVLVVAASVAFLTGAGLVGHAASTELAGVAAEFETPASVTAHDSPEAARRAAGDGAVVLPVARATRPDGTRITVVGVPHDGAAFGTDPSFSVPAAPPPGTVRGPVGTAREVTVEGRTGRASVSLEPRPGSDGLPPRWYVAAHETVRTLGATGALELSPGAGETPVVGVLSFFLVGGRQVLQALWLATGAAGILLGVTVFGTTRMTVRDRVRTLRVARATGARQRTLLVLFGARAALQTGVGIAAGYAVGVIMPNAAVNAAVFLGRSTTLSLRVARPLVAVLGPAYLGLVLVGTLGGVLAALPAVRARPADLTGRAARTGGDSRLPGFLGTELLDWRAVVPTATTLAVFVIVAVLAASTAGVVAPLAGGDGATVMEPGTAHPFNSGVPETYATELRVQGVDASAEILALGVTDGTPYVARGANFSAFGSVTDAEVAEGRAHRRPGEAVVGVDLARTLGVSVGDTLVVGGSTRPAVDRLRIVGAFRAPEPFDDQLVVPLATARTLSGRGPRQVQFVRTAERPDGGGAVGITVVGVETPRQATAGGTVSASVTLLNPTERTRTRTVRLSLDEATASETVELGPGEEATVDLQVPAGTPRETTLVVAGREHPFEVVDPDAIRLAGLPEEAPPGSQPRVRVVTATGDSVANATVTAGDASARTDGEGWTRIPMNTVGETRVVAIAGDRRANATVVVTTDAERRPRLSVAVSPSAPTPATRPTATVSLSNPWNRTLSVPLIVTGPGADERQSVTLAPGQGTAVEVGLGRRPAGTYEVTVRTNGTSLATATYEVTGDQRLAAALASSGRSAGRTGVGRALSTVLGNLEVVVATVLGLAAAMTIGGTTAGFASAVHARRRTLGIHRATGATPRQVLALVLADAVRIGVVATALAIAMAAVVLVSLDAADLLTVYGVRVLATVDPRVVVGAAAASLALALLGACLATLGVLRTAPSALLSAVPGHRGSSGEVADE